jgi:hypothetical protein
LRILAALVLFAGAAQAQTVSKVELQACGIYERTVQAREDDAQSPSGKRTIVEDHRLLNETNRIPGRVGVHFGCQVVLQGAPASGLVTFRAVLRLPPGARREEASGSQAYNIGEPGHVGYTLGSGDALARGEWTLQIWVDQRNLAEKAFFVGSE